MLDFRVDNKITFVVTGCTWQYWNGHLQLNELANAGADIIIM
jgi:hypothetical protein